MATGFEVYNEAGFLVLSDKHATLQYKGKGLATVQGAVSFSSNGSIHIPVPASIECPIVAIQSYGAAGFYYSNDLGNGTVSFVYNTDLQPGTNVAYYLFDLAKNVPASNFGLELYNEAGVRTYSSGTGVANIFAAFNEGSVNLTGGRDYAVVTPSFGGWRTQTAVGNPDIPNDPSTTYAQQGYQYAGYISNTPATGYIAGIREINFLSAASAAPAPDLTVPLQTCLVIDVTPFGPVSGAPSLNNNAPGQAGPPPTTSATIDPGTDSQSGFNSSYQFATRNALPRCPSGVTVTGRNWWLTGQSAHSWSLNSSNGPSTNANVSGVAIDSTATATLNLTISYSNGQTATASPIQLSYSRINQN